ncbi:MAG: peptide ABC transporter substrate-binding protein [Candidatus Eremiobacteraeota bacterium]|nr:peptide ABC transporter substrate-binding protein [Candidatus Eremiobacteraeota bacterium]MBV8282263.1 peptide ABC transporter substrate-binding protein [Candidatus Eremiobacteraeota bacterium]
MLAISGSACSKVSTSAQAPGSARNGHQGVLRIGEIFDPATLNPELATEQTTVDLSMFWTGYLFNWSDADQWVPELATAVPTIENGGISKDGRTITYHLRPNVKWQDGAPFGADDVIFSWHAVMNPANNITSRLGYDLITAIDKKDDHTIVVHLKQPYAPFTASFFTMSGTPYSIMPKHILGGLPNINRAPYNNLPVGTGPFKVAEWHKGSLIRFVANPAYWRGPPKLREIDYYTIPSDDTILLQLRTGELDMEYAAAQSQLPALRGIPGVNVVLNPYTQFAMLAYNLKNPILSDVRVRQALAFGTDRDTIIDKAAHGAPIRADSDQPNFLWAYNPDVPKYRYDPARANALLDAAGWKLGADRVRHKNGRALELVALSPSGSNISDVVFGVLQQDWKAIGVDLTEKQVNTALLSENYYQGGLIQTGKFDVAFYSWLNGVDPDDSVFTMCDQWPPNGQNIDYYCNPKLDAAERIALREYSQAKRKLQYDEIQRLLATDQPFLVVWFNRRVNVLSKQLSGFKPAHAVTEFWNTWEWSI